MAAAQGHPTDHLNICSEDLSSPTIFGLKSDEKLEYYFSSNFCDMGKVMPVVCGEKKKCIVYEKRPASIFGELENSSS